MNAFSWSRAGMKLRKWSFLVFFSGRQEAFVRCKSEVHHAFSCSAPAPALTTRQTNRQLTRPGNTVDFMLPILTCATALDCRF
ncbi:hypothetical protein J3E69DRAFT_325106 [Trichoderma sp. SZMC 28015]